MKTLYVVRHAKSSWKRPLPDKKRPLADRGKRDAPKIGKRLAKRDVRPNLILSSPAKRAITTARIFAKRLRYDPKDIVVDDRLYPGRATQLLRMIRDLDDHWKRVMIFGHNPALAELVRGMSSEITRMPTSAVAQFTFDAKSWSQIGKATLARMTLDYPKMKP
jgi:phosphohistidine phosphatase